jgi:hypothetical protein
MYIYIHMTSPINLENSQAEWLNRLWHIWSPVDVIDRMKPGKAKKVEPGGRKKKMELVSN